MNSLTSFNICFYSELKMKISTTHHPLAIKNTIHLNAIMYEKKNKYRIMQKRFFFQLRSCTTCTYGTNSKKSKKFVIFKSATKYLDQT